MSGPKPFRRFKDALHENSAIREQWCKFHEAALARYAIEWLAEFDIQPLGVTTVKPEVENKIGNREQSA